MTRLVPGQRLWPLRYTACDFSPPVTVESVGHLWARVKRGHRIDDIPADSLNGEHRATGFYPTTYYTDAARTAYRLREAGNEARDTIRERLATADIDTLNRVLTALGLPEVTVWTPPEKTE